MWKQQHRDRKAAMVDAEVTASDPSPALKREHGPAQERQQTEQSQSVAGAGDISESLRNMSTSAASSPLSSAPVTPNLNHAPSTPTQRNTPSRPGTAQRRTSQSKELHRTTSSPRLMRKSSRSSLGGDEEKRPTPKRSISNLIAGLREAQGTMEPIKEPVILTAPDVAAIHFTRELEAHASTEAETVVILHDACYGHRYSRPKTTKTTLSMIVERPERIHASALGAATAYVRLGGHHEGAPNAPHPVRRPETAPPFKIRRTARAMDIRSSYVTAVHGTAWMSELRNLCTATGERLAKGDKELQRSTTPNGVEPKKLHEGDLYLATESLNAFQGALGGVADAVDTVFTSNTKRAFVAIRPPGHHCSADYPSGFCWLNNVHVGLEYAHQTYGLTHAAIIDFDLHHGDGSQAITWARNKQNKDKRWNAKPNSKIKLGPEIGYYSLHDINSYPCEMGDDEKVQAASLCVENAHSQSIWNVHLQPWKTIDEFWELYESRYRILLDKARVFLRHHSAQRKDAKAAVFISAGFDASEWEGAGMQRHKVNVPTEFYARFTHDIRALASEPGSGCDGRVVSVLEGGYSDRALCSGVLSHLSGLCGSPICSKSTAPNGDIAGQLDSAMRGMSLNGTRTSFTYDPDWWSAANLTALENKINPPPPSAPGKKMRVGQQPTYATPTESFAYKVVDPNKFARSISGTMREVSMPARAPTPPPPEVNWVIATQELSKLLIPTDRQTKSFTAEELAGPKPEKKVRQSAIGLGVSTEDVLKPRETRSNRRQTLHDLPLSVADAPAVPALQQRKTSRRSSLASTTSALSAGSEQPPVPALPQIITTTNTTMQPPVAPGPASAGMQVKKTRVLTNGRKPAAPASAPVSPAVRQMSSNLTHGTNGASDGLDALANGMKKISLKVGSREEHDRKLKEQRDAANKARAAKAAETRRVNMAAKKAAAAVVVPALPATSTNTTDWKPSAPVAKPAAATSAPMGSQAAVAKPDAQMTNGSGNVSTDIRAVPESAPLAVDETLATASTTDGDAAGQAAVEIAPMVADELVAPSTLALNEPLQTQSPSDTSTEVANGLPVDEVRSTNAPLPEHLNSAAQFVVPDSAARQLLQEHDVANGVKPEISNSSSSLMRTPIKDRKPLPVWSSTGPIPFAAATASSPLSPRTPKSPWKNHRPAGSRDSVRNGNGVSRTMLTGVENVEAPDQFKVGKQEDIWAVPETPRH